MHPGRQTPVILASTRTVPRDLEAESCGRFNEETDRVSPRIVRIGRLRSRRHSLEVAASADPHQPRSIAPEAPGERQGKAERNMQVRHTSRIPMGDSQMHPLKDIDGRTVRAEGMGFL